MKRKTQAPASEGTDLPLFYAPGFLDTLALPEDESKHASRVLRLSEGDKILVTDGEGVLFSAVLTAVTSKETLFTLEEDIPSLSSPKPYLRLAVAPTKNIDRIEWLLEKMVEVGLSEFTVLYTQRTVRRQTNLERLEKVMVSALKQSRKRFRTRVNECHGIESLFTQSELPAGLSSYIGYCSDEFPKTPIHTAFTSGVPSLFLIGPEGDFTLEEVQTAVRFGATPVTLGDERLRTETAGLYAGMLHSILNS